MVIVGGWGDLGRQGEGVVDSEGGELNRQLRDLDYLQNADRFSLFLSCPHDLIKCIVLWCFSFL